MLYVVNRLFKQFYQNSLKYLVQYPNMQLKLTPYEMEAPGISEREGFEGGIFESKLVTKNDGWVDVPGCEGLKLIPGTHGGNKLIRFLLSKAIEGRLTYTVGQEGSQELPIGRRERRTGDHSEDVDYLTQVVPGLTYWVIQSDGDWILTGKKTKVEVLW
mgnify:CR=1 FL=1